MKEIVKTKEPTSLITYRAGISKDDLESSEMFDTAPSSVKNDLRNKLLQEQGYICCYCMNRVKFSNSKIEHFQPRSSHRKMQLDYTNLFVSCLGGKGRTKKNQHCDTKKGNSPISNINLLTNIEKFLEYSKNGIISSPNSAIDNELNKVLNLNYEELRANREDAFNQLLTELQKTSWKISDIKLNLEKYKHQNSEGKYRPFCEMIVYQLSKKLKSKGVTI